MKNFFEHSLSIRQVDLSDVFGLKFGGMLFGNGSSGCCLNIMWHVTVLLLNYLLSVVSHGITNQMKYSK